LITGHRPPTSIPGDGRQCSRVGDGQLRLRVRRRHPLRNACRPEVALEATVDVKPRLGQNLALLVGGPLDDQLDRAEVCRSMADVIERLFERPEVDHHLISHRA